MSSGDYKDDYPSFVEGLKGIQKIYPVKPPRYRFCARMQLASDVVNCAINKLNAEICDKDMALDSLSYEAGGIFQTCRLLPDFMLERMTSLQKDELVTQMAQKVVDKVIQKIGLFIV